MERKAEKEIKRQQAVAKAAANRAAKEQMEAREAAMAAHPAQQAMSAALAAGATREEAIATGQVAMESVTGAGSSAHMLDRKAPNHIYTRLKKLRSGSLQAASSYRRN